MLSVFVVAVVACFVITKLLAYIFRLGVYLSLSVMIVACYRDITFLCYVKLDRPVVATRDLISPFHNLLMFCIKTTDLMFLNAKIFFLVKISNLIAR